MPEQNDHFPDIAAWQSGGPFIFTGVKISMEGNVCTVILTVGQYSKVVQMTKATARDLHRMLGLRFDDTTDDEQQRRAW